VKIEQSTDMLALRRLYRATFPEDKWENVIGRDALFFVASDDTGPIGFVVLQPADLTPNDFFLSAIGVLKRAKGRAVAVKLIRSAARWAVMNTERDAIVTYVLASNGPSLMSFMRSGWEIYWPTEWMAGVNVVYFRKKLR